MSADTALMPIPGPADPLPVPRAVVPRADGSVSAIGIVITPAFARVVRGAVLEVMGFPFVESSRALGASHSRIMVRHVFPNIAAPLIVLVTVYLSTAILSAAAPVRLPTRVCSIHSLPCSTVNSMSHMSL